MIMPPTIATVPTMISMSPRLKSRFGMPNPMANTPIAVAIKLSDNKNGYIAVASPTRAPRAAPRASKITLQMWTAPTLKLSGILILLRLDLINPLNKCKRGNSIPLYWNFL